MLRFSNFLLCVVKSLSTLMAYSFKIGCQLIEGLREAGLAGSVSLYSPSRLREVGSALYSVVAYESGERNHCVLRG